MKTRGAVYAMLAAALAVGGNAAAAPEAGTGAGAPRGRFMLRSKAFMPGGTIPIRYTCDDADVSPPLNWTAPPRGTKSLVLLMEDPDAPGGAWVHWLIYDLPASTRRLPEKMARLASLPSGAKQGASWGVDSFERTGYCGPCPPPGVPHHYVFRLFALAVTLGLPPRATKAQVVEAMKGRIIGRADLVGLFGR